MAQKTYDIIIVGSGPAASAQVPGQEPRIKRYILTDKGKIILEEHVKRRQELRKRTGFFPPPFIGHHWFNHYPEKANEFVEAGKKLVMSSWPLQDNLHERYSEEAATKAKKILEQAAKEIDEIVSKLKDTR